MYKVERPFEGEEGQGSDWWDLITANRLGVESWLKCFYIERRPLPHLQTIASHSLKRSLRCYFILSCWMHLTTYELMTHMCKWLFLSISCQKCPYSQCHWLHFRNNKINCFYNNKVYNIEIVQTSFPDRHTIMPFYFCEDNSEFTSLRGWRM